MQSLIQIFNKVINKVKSGLKVKRNWLVFVPILLICAFVGYLAYLYVVLTPQLAGANFNTILPITSKILDRDGNLLYEVGGEVKRDIAAPEELPDLLREATVAAEDRDFYAHPGVNLKSISRAALANMQAGRVVEGGSTITQQLVKNTLLTSERTVERKLREATLAVMIETRMSKDEILTAYLNSVSYGSNIRGVKKASEAFFGKKLHELNLSEIATLAALPQAPSYLSLYNGNKEALDARRNEILNQLQKKNVVSAEEVEAAKSTELAVKPISHPIVAPHFSLMVRDLVIQYFGREKVENGGLVIRTTLDSKLQAEVEKIVPKYKGRINGYGASNAGAVVLDTKTGQILSLIGSLDYYDSKIDGNVNIAIAPRQPGSSFKPIVYSALFAKTSYSPATIVYDVATNFGGGYVPRNASDRNYGSMPFAKALSGSLNIPAVKAGALVGVDKILDNAENLGITTLTEREKYGLAVSLGAGEVRLTELTAAFATFGNQGRFNPAASILSVEDSQGNKLYEFSPAQKEVLPSEVAYQLNHTLSDNSKRSYIFGPSSSLAFPGHQVAAKTGTSQNFRDGWTLGYTTSRAVGVWVGNNDGRYMRGYGESVAGGIWREILTRSMQGIAFEEFPRPESLRLVNGEYIAPWQLSGDGKLAQAHEQPLSASWRTAVQTYLAKKAEDEKAEQERQAQALNPTPGIEPGMGGAPEEDTPPTPPPAEPNPPAQSPPPAATTASQ